MKLRLVVFVFLLKFNTWAANPSNIESLNEGESSGTEEQLTEAVPLLEPDLPQKNQSQRDENNLEQDKTKMHIFQTQDPIQQRVYRMRSYFFIDGFQTKGSSDDKVYVPNSQFSISGDFNFQAKNFFIFDGVANYDQKTKVSNTFVNQIGMRSAMGEYWQSFFGKERNRRSPGLVVSPSDFIYANTNLPGLREDRSGLWLARLSYQKIKYSLDLLLMPLQSETNEGWLKFEKKQSDFVMRFFEQLHSFDWSIILGQYLGRKQVGISLQTLFENKYKMYLETSTTEYVEIYSDTQKINPVQSLLGLGYEGSEKFSFRLEYYHNGQGLSSDEFRKMLQFIRTFPTLYNASQTKRNIFLRQKYIIGSLVVPDIEKKYNLTFSTIKSIEDNSAIHVARFEYSASDKILLGLSNIQILGSSDSQFYFREFDTQTAADFKYSF